MVVGREAIVRKGLKAPSTLGRLNLTDVEIATFLRTAIDKIEQHFYLLDSSSHILYANHAACNSLERTRRELLKLAVCDINPEYTSAAVKEVLKQTRRGGYYKLESVHRAKSGRIFPVSVYIIYQAFMGKAYFFAFVNDTSEKVTVSDLSVLS